MIKKYSEEKRQGVIEARKAGAAATAPSGKRTTGKSNTTARG